MSDFRSASTTNLLSSGTIAPEIEVDDLEAGRANIGRTPATSNNRAGQQLGEPQSSSTAASAAGGQMNVPDREQSIWEQSA